MQGEEIPFKNLDGGDASVEKPGDGLLTARRMGGDCVRPSAIWWPAVESRTLCVLRHGVRRRKARELANASIFGLWS
jgi:hypothetical protein